MTIRIERAYASKSNDDGARFLVDRVWPRGITRDALRLDGWLRDVAPSDSLRKWFAHDAERWVEFERRYFAELDAKRDAIAPLVDAATRGDVTLVFGAKDEEHNNAVALRDYLSGRREASSRDALVDETLDESFPASDPPAWTSTHAGPPKPRGAR